MITRGLGGYSDDFLITRGLGSTGIAVLLAASRDYSMERFDFNKYSDVQT